MYLTLIAIKTFTNYNETQISGAYHSYLLFIESHSLKIHMSVTSYLKRLWMDFHETLSNSSLSRPEK